jgi:lipopolysaccharide transport system ATP-binding protein
MTDDVMIRAEGLGKKYIIGHQAERESYTALRDVLTRNLRGWARSAGDMLRGKPLVTGDETEDFWALKDINFEIRRGDVVGIIGRNGAGKSTLLKILSRITEPTEGRVTINGRVASLLEVGTGFHPELSGRENIYLNGAILGMSRAEIRRKFDEIVDFAGVEKFLDTPVKRYSSGMYVRLAFAVAAHLEPEILIIDEVLAVGDAEFQKKCLGKMKDVAGQGRTVLFVSHNLGAIQNLCKSSVYLKNGKIIGHFPINKSIEAYLSDSKSQDKNDIKDLNRSGVGQIMFSDFYVLNSDRNRIEILESGKEYIFVFEIKQNYALSGAGRISFVISDTLDRPLINFASDVSKKDPIVFGLSKNIYCKVKSLPLPEGDYIINLFLEVNGEIQDWVSGQIGLKVQGGSFYGTNRNSPDGWNAVSVLVPHQWMTEDNLKINEIFLP